MYECIALFDVYSGKPLGSSCTCTADQDEACTHVAGMLFAMKDFISREYHVLSNDAASTELVCTWNAPKDPKVEPVPLCDLDYGSSAPGESGKRRQKPLYEHHPVAPKQREIDPEAYIHETHP